MDPQTLALLVSAMTQANGGDPSAAYLDPVLAYLTGSYTPERRWTDEELMAINAPTLSAYTQVGPDGNLVIRPGITGDRKKEVEAILAGASPYDVAGDNTDDRELMDFLQSLAEERAKFFQQQISRDSRKDQFEEMGLPGYGKGYSLDQISTMYGDSLGNTPYMAAASEMNDARLAERNRNLLAEFASKGASATDAQIEALRAEEERYTKAGDPARAYARSQKRKTLESKRPDSKKQEENYRQTLAAEERRATASPGGMGYENLRNQYQMQALASALEASGRTPLSDALVSSAMLKRLLGR
jgi:hypothetical protein